MWSRNKKLKRRNLPDPLGKKEEEELIGQHWSTMASYEHLFYVGKSSVRML